MSLISSHAIKETTRRRPHAISPLTAVVGSLIALGAAFVIDRSDVLASTTPTLAADPADPLRDSDRDLLPDRLELMLLTDPHDPDTDHDGVGDFLAAAQFRRPFDPPGTPRPLDDEMRVAISSSANAEGKESVWVHFLFRFVGASPSELRSIDPYLDHWGTRLPIASVLGTGNSGIALRSDPVEGLLCVASFEIGSETALRAIMPFTLGATATVGSRVIRSGAYVQIIDNAATVLTAADDDKGLVMALDAEQNQDPFWSSSRVCVMQLEVLSTSPAGSLCEVRNAECMSSGRLACPPTCIRSRGKSMFFPDGMSTVTGSTR